MTGVVSALRRSNAGARVHAVEPAPGPAPYGPLIEREAELELLAAAVDRLAAGGSGVVMLEAPAGLGKTALLEHAAALATAAGCLVRRAAPGPLERHFPFGVVRALLEAPLRDVSVSERAQPLDGALASAGELLLQGVVPGGEATMPVAHSVLWLCAALADCRPLALLVDDAQWADRSSLEVLSYLARRVEDLPLLIVVAARAEDPEAPSDLLGLLAGVRSARVLQPQPLTARGAAVLIRRLAPDTRLSVCRDCQRAVGGNPWLLGELARQIAAHGPEAIDRPVEDAYAAVARNGLRRRLAELSPRDRAVVAALAIAGDDAPAHVLAEVSGIGFGELAPARDALLAAGLLGPDGERFAHGLIAGGVAAGLPRTERERLHREAARALMAAGADADRVAGHLLECAPRGDAAVSELLRRAAVGAKQRGAAHSAVAYLERALEERARGDNRGQMLALLAAVTFDAGLPDARGRLLAALREVHDRASRLDVLTRLAALNVIDAGDADLAHVFEQELAAETDPDARLAVEVAALDTLMLLPDRHAERARRVASLNVTPTTDPLLERVVLAHRAWVGIERGTPGAAAGAALAEQALDGGFLLAEAGRRSAYHLALRALILTDRAEAAERAIAALEDAAHDSLRLRSVAAWHASELALRTGRIVEAEALARIALELNDGVNVITGGVLNVLVCALAERGAVEEAHEVLRERGLDGDLGRMRWEISMRHSRARLWLAEGDFERAYEEASETGRLRQEQELSNPTWTPWRSTAALALAHLGRREEAAALAAAELALAETFGAPVPIARALHACAVTEPDAGARVRIASRGLSVISGVPAGLAAIRLQLELGSALAYIGRRVQAREALRPALAEADAAGATLLAQRARRELVATGLRPRQAATEGAAALTPRQRQICELAAAGKGNRAIAQQLFLSIKTVETHLAAGYRKLGVNTREGLAAQLLGDG
jgi:DNA-binding CsgD family transcriptional regulator